MRKYQGEDIYFSLKFNSSDNPAINSFSDISNLVVYAYTNKDRITKFSKNTVTGYYPLISITDIELQGVIGSSETAEMHGQVIIDVLAEIPSIDGDLENTLIQKVYSGIFVSESIIKTEAK